MNESDPRSKPSSAELSWTTSLLLIGVAALVVFGGLAWRQNSAEPEPPAKPAAELAPVVSARPSTVKKAGIQGSTEVEELRQKLEELERDREAQAAEKTKSSQAAVELLARVLAEGQEEETEELPVELSSGPFTKTGSNVAQVTFSLSHPGKTRRVVPVRVKLFRDGQEVDSSSFLAEIGPQDNRAYSVVLETDGPGNYAASVELVRE